MAPSNILPFQVRTQSFHGSTPVQYGAQLTAREIEVIEMAHLTNHRIAMVLGCEESTVKSHFRHINGKLGTKNRTEAFRAYVCGHVSRAA